MHQEFFYQFDFISKHILIVLMYLKHVAYPVKYFCLNQVCNSKSEIILIPLVFLPGIFSIHGILVFIATD